MPETKPYRCADGFFLFVCPFCFGEVDPLSPAPAYPDLPNHAAREGQFETRVRMHQRCAHQFTPPQVAAVVESVRRVLVWECRSHLN